MMPPPLYTHGLPAKLTHATSDPLCPSAPAMQTQLTYPAESWGTPRLLPRRLARTEAGSAMQLQVQLTSQVVCGQTGRLKICQNASDNEIIP